MRKNPKLQLKRPHRALRAIEALPAQPTSLRRDAPYRLLAR
jgi:hypothetical protein